MNIAVLCSGGGTNLQAIIDKVRTGFIPAKISLVVSDNGAAYALERAKKAGVKTLFLDPKSFKSREEFDREAVRNLKAENVELVVLAGFMRLLSPYFIKEYRHRIMNIHPALLPSFKGMHGVKDALMYGAKITGPTVHFVDEELDNGPIILQSPVEIRADDSEDSLLERVHAEEHKIYPLAVKYFAEGKIKIEGRVVKISP